MICATVFVWVWFSIAALSSLFEQIKPAACCYPSHEIVKFTLSTLSLGKNENFNFEVGQFSREKLYYSLQRRKKKKKSHAWIGLKAHDFCLGNQICT